MASTTTERGHRERTVAVQARLSSIELERFERVLCGMSVRAWVMAQVEACERSSRAKSK